MEPCTPLSLAQSQQFNQQIALVKQLPNCEKMLELVRQANELLSNAHGLMLDMYDSNPEIVVGYWHTHLSEALDYSFYVLCELNPVEKGEDNA